MFFFSSRRRHTRFDCDWSSDVCSSDLDRAILCVGGRVDLSIARAVAWSEDEVFHVERQRYTVRYAAACGGYCFYVVACGRVCRGWGCTDLFFFPPQGWCFAAPRRFGFGGGGGGGQRNGGF